MATVVMAAVYAVAQFWTPPSLAVGIVLAAMDLGAVIPQYVPTFEIMKQRWDDFTPKNATSIAEHVTGPDDVETATSAAIHATKKKASPLAIQVTISKPVSLLKAEGITVNVKPTDIQYHAPLAAARLKVHFDRIFANSRLASTDSKPTIVPHERNTARTEPIAAQSESTKDDLECITTRYQHLIAISDRVIDSTPATIATENAIASGDEIDASDTTVIRSSSTSNANIPAPANKPTHTTSFLNTVRTSIVRAASKSLTWPSSAYAFYQANIEDAILAYVIWHTLQPDLLIHVLSRAFADLRRAFYPIAQQIGHRLREQVRDLISPTINRLNRLCKATLTQPQSLWPRLLAEIQIWRNWGGRVFELGPVLGPVTAVGLVLVLTALMLLPVLVLIQYIIECIGTVLARVWNATNAHVSRLVAGLSNSVSPILTQSSTFIVDSASALTEVFTLIGKSRKLVQTTLSPALKTGMQALAATPSRLTHFPDPHRLNPLSSKTQRVLDRLVVTSSLIRTCYDNMCTLSAWRMLWRVPTIMVIVATPIIAIVFLLRARLLRRTFRSLIAIICFCLGVDALSADGMDLLRCTQDWLVVVATLLLSWVLIAYNPRLAHRVNVGTNDSEELSGGNPRRQTSHGVARPTRLHSSQNVVPGSSSSTVTTAKTKSQKSKPDSLYSEPLSPSLAKSDIIEKPLLDPALENSRIITSPMFFDDVTLGKSRRSSAIASQCPVTIASAIEEIDESFEPQGLKHQYRSRRPNPRKSSSPLFDPFGHDLLEAENLRLDQDQDLDALLNVPNSPELLIDGLPVVEVSQAKAPPTQATPSRKSSFIGIIGSHTIPRISRSQVFMEEDDSDSRNSDEDELPPILGAFPDDERADAGFISEAKRNNIEQETFQRTDIIAEAGSNNAHFTGKYDSASSHGSELRTSPPALCPLPWYEQVQRPGWMTIHDVIERVIERIIIEMRKPSVTAQQELDNVTAPVAHEQAQTEQPVVEQSLSMRPVFEQLSVHQSVVEQQEYNLAPGHVIPEPTHPQQPFVKQQTINGGKALVDTEYPEPQQIILEQIVQRPVIQEPVIESLRQSGLKKSEPIVVVTSPSPQSVAQPVEISYKEPEYNSAPSAFAIGNDPTLDFFGNDFLQRINAVPQPDSPEEVDEEFDRADFERFVANMQPASIPAVKPQDMAEPNDKAVVEVEGNLVLISSPHVDTHMHSAISPPMNRLFQVMKPVSIIAPSHTRTSPQPAPPVQAAIFVETTTQYQATTDTKSAAQVESLPNSNILNPVCTRSSTKERRLEKLRSPPVRTDVPKTKISPIEFAPPKLMLENKLSANGFDQTGAMFNPASLDNTIVYSQPSTTTPKSPPLSPTRPAPCSNTTERKDLALQVNVPDLGQGKISPLLPSLTFSLESKSPVKDKSLADPEQASQCVSGASTTMDYRKDPKPLVSGDEVPEISTIHAKVQDKAPIKEGRTEAIDTAGSAATSMNPALLKPKSSESLPISPKFHDAAVSSANTIPPPELVRKPNARALPVPIPRSALLTNLSSMPQQKHNPAGGLTHDDFSLPDAYQRPAARPANPEHVNSREQLRNRLLGDPSTLTRMYREEGAKAAKQITKELTPSGPADPSAGVSNGSKPDSNAPDPFPPSDIYFLKKALPKKNDVPNPKKEDDEDMDNDLKSHGGDRAVAMNTAASSTTTNIGTVPFTAESGPLIDALNYQDTDMLDDPYLETDSWLIAPTLNNFAGGDVAMSDDPIEELTDMCPSTTAQANSMQTQDLFMDQLATSAIPGYDDSEMFDDGQVVEMGDAGFESVHSGFTPNLSPPQILPDQEMWEVPVQTQRSLPIFDPSTFITENVIAQNGHPATAPLPFQYPTATQHASMAIPMPIVPSLTVPVTVTSVIASAETQIKCAPSPQSVPPTSDISHKLSQEQIDELQAFLNQHQAMPTDSYTNPDSQSEHQPSNTDILNAYKSFMETINDDAVTNSPVLSEASSGALSDEMDDDELDALGKAVNGFLAEQDENGSGAKDAKGMKDNKTNDFSEFRVEVENRVEIANAEQLAARKLIPLKIKKRMPSINVGPAPLPHPEFPTPTALQLNEQSNQKLEEDEPDSEPTLAYLESVPQFAPGWDRLPITGESSNTVPGDGHNTSLDDPASNTQVTAPIPQVVDPITNRAIDGDEDS